MTTEDHDEHVTAWWARQCGYPLDDDAFTLRRRLSLDLRNAYLAGVDRQLDTMFPDNWEPIGILNTFLSGGEPTTLDGYPLDRRHGRAD